VFLPEQDGQDGGGASPERVTNKDQVKFVGALGRIPAESARQNPFFVDFVSYVGSSLNHTLENNPILEFYQSKLWQQSAL